MRRFTPMRFSAVATLVTLACSSSPNDAKKPAADAGDAGADVVVDTGIGTDAPDTNDASDAPDPACQALSEKLATAIEEARVATGSRDAALAVSRPGCSTAIVRGESNLTPEHLFRVGSITK